MDIVRRKLLLVTIGTSRVKAIQMKVAAGVLSFGPFITLYCGVVILLGAVCAVVLMYEQ